MHHLGIFQDLQLDWEHESAIMGDVRQLEDSRLPVPLLYTGRRLHVFKYSMPHETSKTYNPILKKTD